MFYASYRQCFICVGEAWKIVKAHMPANRYVCACVRLSGCDEVVRSSPLTSYTDSHQFSFPLLWVLPGKCCTCLTPGLDTQTPHIHTKTQTHSPNTDATVCHSAMIREGGGRCEKAHPDCTNTQDALQPRIFHTKLLQAKLKQ